MSAQSEKELEEKNPEVLLDVANQSSERLAVQHTAFIAACAYMLVIVFGTTDLDLLIGKGIKLPFVDVEMPIVGFFAFAPFILVLVHFNLLLQLQLLSRKLFAFDAAAQQENGIGGLRDRLHIFPFTYYLVGQPSPLVKPFLAVMVSITLVLLPLFVLFSLQLEFLAYQDESVTRLQRMAIWLDIVLITIFWPTILHPKDDWKSYWRTLIAVHVPRRRVVLSFTMLFGGLVLVLFSVYGVLFYLGVLIFLLLPLSIPLLRGWKATPRTFKYFMLNPFIVVVIVVSPLLVPSILNLNILPLLFWSVLMLSFTLLWHHNAPRGSFVLLLTLFAGSLLPLAFMVDGEDFEHFVVDKQLLLDIDAIRFLDKQFGLGFRFKDTGPQDTLLSFILSDKRRLDLDEQHLFAKPPKPETLALIRSGKWEEGLTQLEPINLKHRNLRHARMEKAMLVGADVRSANLQGANLEDANFQRVNLRTATLVGVAMKSANLQGADLRGAKLQAADLQSANFQGADLSSANLQGAKLMEVQFQGADLSSANLQGDYLGLANLQGASLVEAHLQGAYFWGVQLQGADLRGAQLQGAYLGSANLQGVDLSLAQLYAVDLNNAKTTLVDVRGVQWVPLGKSSVDELVREVLPFINQEARHLAIERWEKAMKPDAAMPFMGLIFAELDTPFSYVKRYDPQNQEEFADFTRQLHAYLATLAYESPEIARGIIRQIPKHNEFVDDEVLKLRFSRYGLAAELKKNLDDKNCKGLQGLTREERDELRNLK